MTQRIIKFRAWDGEAWFGFSVDSVGGSLGEFLQTKAVAICQFTGLKERNGKEIYEGDLMRSIPNEHEPQEILEVFWDDQLNGFAMRNKDKNYQTPIMETIYTIIGNIYENPELLK